LGVQDDRMRRVAAAFAFIFVTSLVLASYGHCWPMLVQEIAQLEVPMAHDHGSHHKQHHHPTEGFGQELSVPGVPSGPVAIVQAPIAKDFAPILLVVAVADDANVYVENGPHHRARAGPAAFQEFHARTGRLLI
jgi:hypothetical protein